MRGSWTKFTNVEGIDSMPPSPLFLPSMLIHPLPDVRPRCCREFQKASAELAAELERAAPNMKALEQYDAVKEKEREQARGDIQGFLPILIRHFYRPSSSLVSLTNHADGSLGGGEEGGAGGGPGL